MSTKTSILRHTHDLTAHGHVVKPSPDKLSIKQLSILFLSLAAFGLGIATYAGSQKDEMREQDKSTPATATADQAGRLLLRP